MRRLFAALAAVCLLLTACTAGTKGMKTCTLSISCAALCGVGNELDAEKGDLVPADGWMLAPTEVAFADGEYIEVLLDHDTDELLNLEYGEWEIVKGKVEAQAEDDPGTTVYKYTGGKLKNGDLKYTRISDDAEEILDLFF